MPNPLNTEFDPVTHIGKVNGEIWPSVTQLLSEFRLIDFSSVPADRLEFKRILGTRVHAATVMVDNCSLDESHFNAAFPECVPYLEAYRKFRVIENFEPLHKENRLFSKKWRFHGAPDELGLHICKMGVNHSLIDYKTTWTDYPATGNQLAGYSMLIEECLGIKINKRFALILKPTGNYDLIQHKDPRDFQEFQACLVLHWAKREKHKTSKGEFENDNIT